ncbi:MAG: hypothetical protein U5L96_13190 [Owenweeksia sp.]|nr:hypothetical protein [Owenweeksia sp.]
MDTHTSNGADYQYTMSLITTQKDKLNPHLARLLTSEDRTLFIRQYAKSRLGNDTLCECIWKHA